MKKIKILLATLLISSVAAAQVVNFSGSWKLNTSKSKLNTEFSFAPKTITLVQNGNNLNVEKLSTFDYQDYTTNDKLTLDGKECINPGWQDFQKKSTAVWSEDKKSLIITSKVSTDSDDIIIKEVYKMDGSNMVLESSLSSYNGEMSETIFYDKQ